MLSPHQIRIFIVILIATVVSGSKGLAEVPKNPTAPKSAATTKHAAPGAKPPAVKPAPKASQSASQEEDEDAHLHGYIPDKRKHKDPVVLHLEMGDPVGDNTTADDEPVVLQEQAPKVAVPEGVVQKGTRSDALPHYNLANRYLNQGRFEDAARKYRDAITIYGSEADFYVNLGVALRKLNDYVGAEQAFKQALALNATDWMSWSNLANAYLKQDKLVDSIKAFQQCLKCKPPPQERVAIEQDIKDMTKILRMRDPNFDAHPSTKAKPETANKKRTTATSKSPTANTKSASASSKSESANSKTTASLKQPADPEKLRGSGWDYVYK